MFREWRASTLAAPTPSSAEDSVPRANVHNGAAGRQAPQGHRICWTAFGLSISC